MSHDNAPLSPEFNIRSEKLFRLKDAIKAEREMRKSLPLGMKVFYATVDVPQSIVVGTFQLIGDSGKALIRGAGFKAKPKEGFVPMYQHIDTNEKYVSESFLRAHNREIRKGLFFKSQREEMAAAYEEHFSKLQDHSALMATGRLRPCVIFG